MLSIKLSNIVIIICVLLLVGIHIYNKIEYQEHLKKINNIAYDDFSTKYIGYIEIERLGVKRGIVDGINDTILNANDVGFGKIDNKIILAGHSIENVFGKLHQIKVDDIINIYLYRKKTTYKVVSVKVVNKKDIQALDNALNLVTCMYNPNERLIIGAQKNT